MMRVLLALALAMVLAGCAAPRPPAAATPVLAGIPPAPSRAELDAVRARGVGFLLHSQHADGSWGSFHSDRPLDYEVMTGTSATHDAWRDATTGLCLMALIPWARTQDAAAAAVDRAARFLFSRQVVLRATPEEFNSVWAQIYVLEAAAAVLQDPRLAAHHDQARSAARAQIAALGPLQGCEGGFGYYDFHQGGAPPSGKLSTSFTTAVVLIALHHAAQAGVPVPATLIATTRASLERMRLPTGAFVYSVGHRLRPQGLANQVKGSIGRNQACNLALHLDGNPGDGEALKSGLDAFFTYHHFIEMGKGRPYPHESWYQTAGYYFFFGHYYAAQVAGLLAPAEGCRYRDGLANILCRLQDEDGSWWDFPLYGYHKPYGTAFALLTLDAAGM